MPKFLIMNVGLIKADLSRNKNVFKALLCGLPEAGYLWKPASDRWCLLEIVCHLYDEEREDFRARVRHSLNNNLQTPPPPQIDPVAWVTDRRYIEQNYEEKLTGFLKERERSVGWLKTLENPRWDNAYDHPKLGKMSAGMFLSNWLAHDYIHIRQILKVKYSYLKAQTGETLDYAGNW